MDSSPASGVTSALTRTLAVIFGTLFFGIFAAVGGAGAFFMGKMAWSSAQTRFWTQTPCTVLVSKPATEELEPSSTSKSEGAIDIRYRYTFAGKEYESSTIRRQGLNNSSRDDVELLSRYRAGSPSICWVNPKAPGEAVLQRGSLWMMAIPLFPMIFFAVGAGGIVMTWSRNLRPAGTRRSYSSASTSQSSGRWIGLVFLFMGLLFFWLVVGIPAAKLYQARTWVKTPCTVESSSVISSSGKNGSTYRPEVVYRYEYQGVEYRSARYDLMEVSSSGRAGKEAVVRKYKPGTKATCFVNPEEPWEATINRSASWFMLFGLLPLIFIVIGIAALLPERSKTTSAPRRPEVFSPGTHMPDRVRPGVARGVDGRFLLKSAASPFGKLVVAIFIAAFWNGIVSIFLYQLVSQWQKGTKEWFLAIFLIPFELVGIGLLVAVGHAILNLFNPRVRISVASESVPLGGEVDVHWTVSGAARRIRHFRIVLEGRETTRSGSGKSTKRHESIFARSVLLDTTDTMRMQKGAAKIPLPADAMHTFDGGTNKIEWLIKVTGDIDWYPDVSDEFALHVAPGRS